MYVCKLVCAVFCSTFVIVSLSVLTELVNISA
jgi:hypothetical protein